MPGNRRRRSRTAVPPLVRLRYAPAGRNVYCELCGEPIKVGESMAWWQVPRWPDSSSTRPTAYCEKYGCHSACVRAGKAVR